MAEDKNRIFSAIMVVFLLAGGLSLTGCDRDSSSASSATLCPAAKPEGPVACTLEYDPVCGQLASGAIRTYDNKCTACADSQVVSYIRGKCPSP